MTNSIRTPKQGLSATSRRIAKAVDDEAWQEFRISLKGKSTQRKLDLLYFYWNSQVHEPSHVVRASDSDDAMQYNCDVCIRVHNYLTALARGGQIASTTGYLKKLLGRELVIRK